MKAASRAGAGKAAAGEGRIYQLKVSLKRSKPLIWRRLLVPGDLALHWLHIAIQHSMGWANTHLHDFFIKGQHYGDPSAGKELGFMDEGEFTLEQVVSEAHEKFLYEYDFGDDWEHEVVVEKITGPAPGENYPICTGGGRACPPEDCGGVWGYKALLESLQDKKHPHHAQARQWMGYDFDADEFSLKAVNRELAFAFKKRKPAV